LLMKRIVLIITGLIVLLVISACGNMSPFVNGGQMSGDHMNKSEDGNHSSSNCVWMKVLDHDMLLHFSAGEHKLNMPPMLKSVKETEDEVYYTIDAQQGQTEIFDGVQTETLGYNSSFLGPVVKLKKGQTAHIKLKNSLDEETTFHWHGLIIDGEADGG